MQVPSGLPLLVPITEYVISSSLTPGTPEISTNSSRWLSPPSDAAWLSPAVVSGEALSSPELPHAAAARTRTRNAPAKLTRLDRNTAPPGGAVVVVPGTKSDTSVRIRSDSSPTRLGPLVVVEAATRLPTQQPRVHHARQERRGRVERLLELLVERLGHRHGGVEADQVREVQRAHRVGAALHHAGVDVLGGGEA